MNTTIAQAREAYLAKRPFDPAKNAVMTQDLNGDPNGFMTFPDVGELGILGSKLGMEYLAIVNDGEDAVEEWIHLVLSMAKTPQLAGILFANVFRGMDAVVGAFIHQLGFDEKIREFATTSWQMDFGADDASGGTS